MSGADWKQIPNLELVFVVAFLQMLFVDLGLRGLIYVLWFKNRILAGRVAVLEADIKTIHDKCWNRLDSLEANVKAMHGDRL